MDTPERGILRNAGKNGNGDEEANLGAVKEQDGVESEKSSDRDGKAKNSNQTQVTLQGLQY
jgi:hypothetical protein